MNHILFDSGQLRVPQDAPLCVDVTVAEKLKMPFAGMVVFSSKNPNPDFGTGGMYDFRFSSYQHTTKLQFPEGVEGVFEYEFPSLKDLNNQFFRTDRDYMVLVAQPSLKVESSTLSSINTAFMFLTNPENEGELSASDYFGDNVIGSTWPSVLLLEYERDDSLPLQTRNIGPRGLSKGDGVVEGIKEQMRLANSLVLPPRFRLYAFDRAGHQTEAKSALINLGESPESLGEANNGEVKVHFVDLHGNTVLLDDFPLNKVRITQNLIRIEDTPMYRFNGDRLNFVSVPTAAVPENEELYLYRDLQVAVWPGRDTSFISLPTPPVVIPPGAGPESWSIELPLMEDLPADQFRHGFVRICVFHPSQEFQTEIGGAIKPKADGANFTFANNQFHYFSRENEVQVFNQGDDFFADLYKEVKSLGEGDVWYQTSWSTYSHQPMLGKAHSRSLEWELVEAKHLQEQINKIKNSVTLVPLLTKGIEEEEFFFSAFNGNDANGNGSIFSPFATMGKLNELLSESGRLSKVLAWFERGGDYSDAKRTMDGVPKTELLLWGAPKANLSKFHEDEEEPPLNIDFLAIPQNRDFRQHIQHTSFFEAHLAASIDGKKQRTHGGFIRQGNLPSFHLWGTGGPKAMALTGSWKDPRGLVDTYRIAQQSDEPYEIADNIYTLNPLPLGYFSLGVNEAVLSQTHIVRQFSFAQIQSDWSQAGNDDLHLVVFVPQAGTHHFFPLNQDPAALNHVLTNEAGLDEADFQGHSFGEMAHAHDEIAVALVASGPQANYDFEAHLLTGFRLLRFSDRDHNAGHIPLHDGELGALYRQAIHEQGVDVKTLFWEQHLAGLKPDEPKYQRGENNNRKLTNLINAPFTPADAPPGAPGRRGHAILDRSTRQQGSFHQKATVLIRTKEDRPGEALLGETTEIIAYVGGIDLAQGRWDTRYFHPSDPDRVGGPWWDIHAKLKGKAALDLLYNFQQRWENLGRFLRGDNPRLPDLELNPYTPLNHYPNGENWPNIKIPGDFSFKDLTYPGEGPLVQISRTIPPFSGHERSEADHNGRDLILDRKGELANLVGFSKALDNGRRFAIVVDQYFYNMDMGIKLHERLADPEHPLDFVIVAIPKELNDDAMIDPVMHRQRENVMNAVRYGVTEKPDWGSFGLNGGDGTDQPDFQNPICGKYLPKGEDIERVDVSHKVVFIYPSRGDEGKAVYIHAKHLIVDDIWMGVGSANLSTRSLTYDWEISAQIVDGKLDKGGTLSVKDQRIEVLQRLVGLPPAYSAILEDPYATFRLLKARERNGAANVYPMAPGSRIINPRGLPAGDGIVVIPENSSFSLSWLVCNVLDPDGRNQSNDRIGYIAQIFGIGFHLPDGVVNLNIGFSNDSRIDLGSRLQLAPLGERLFIEIRATVTIHEADRPDREEGPYLIFREAFAADSSPEMLVLERYPTNVLGAEVVADKSYLFRAEIVDEAGAVLPWSGEVRQFPNQRELGDLNEAEDKFPPNFEAGAIERVLEIG